MSSLKIDGTLTVTGGGYLNSTEQIISVTESDLSSSDSGYVKFSNGLIIAWMLASSTTSSTGTVNNLPVAFTSTSSYMAVACAEGYGAYAEPRVEKTSTSTVTVAGKSMYSSSTYYADTYYLLAIGY